MIKSIEREPMLDALLTALERERHVRAPLLNELIDELDAAPPSDALPLAKTLLERIERREPIDAHEMKARIEEMRQRIFQAA